ncbi:hypothetical protein [Cognatishimia sp. MH4019]|uniref:hypothetical protein n=1 Tax=Cognatishimia sp. MH4019 TaxID=2854030 RepID=UPI001CD6D297|nr:hypothetical protein [Cognatishimia sp. MH4019]
MATKVEQMHSYDRSSGENHCPTNPARPLQYNLKNMAVGRLELGSEEWWKSMCDGLHQWHYPELQSVFKGRRLPQFVSDRLTTGHKTWIKSAQTHPDQKRVGSPPKHNLKARRAMEILRGAPLSRTGFITVVASFEGSEEQAILAAEKEAKRLDAFLRRRFDHPVCLLFPEIDQKVVEEVDGALIPKTNWKFEYDEKQRVFKVHFHGVIYVPGFRPNEIEQAFRRNRNGKRNKLYSGANQVRVIPVREAPGFNDGTPDIEGCCGYSTKYHYNPPVKERMLEGFVSWLIVTDAIIQNPKSIVCVGIQSGIQKFCKVCETYHQIDSWCACEPIMQQDQTFYSDSPSPSRHVHDDEGSCCEQAQFTSCGCPNAPPRTGSILNSLSLSDWKRYAKWAQKKTLAFIDQASWIGPAVAHFFRKPQGP